ncbi:hypothetical protein [Malikia sp.]|uniref:hypothetical protein n=1 Tax=Malikia sp. TaxID=2070706 RepID=UPI0026172FDF|nr:hypothetical protein [Malikia sp.]MDD2728431.1 hypothetical protein [Malikia sp.]
MQSDLNRFPLFRSILAGFGLCLTLGLAGCELPGLDNGAQIEARKMADSKAIGSGCRHSLRSIEDCYENNPKASKAAIFEGWREMDGYMREKNIEGMPFHGVATEAAVKSEEGSTQAKDAAKKH